jgi:hypothetical protein
MGPFGVEPQRPFGRRDLDLVDVTPGITPSLFLAALPANYRHHLE